MRTVGQPPAARRDVASGSSRTGTATAITPEFETAWRRWLHDGVMPGTAFPAKTVNVKPVAQTPVAQGFSPAPQGSLEIVFRNDPAILDGRFANNGWLQELPKPITRLTWDNAVVMSPATAARLKIGTAPAAQGGEHGQVVSNLVELRYGGRTVRGARVPGRRSP